MVNLPRPPYGGGGRFLHNMHGSPFIRSFGHPNFLPRQGTRLGARAGFRGPQQFQGQQINNWGPFRGMQQTNQGGGLLARLFGSGQQSGAVRGMQAIRGASQVGSGSGGSFLQTLANPGAINGFLNNTQQMLKTAQSIGPMVQQYGPMVRNIPAMWKLYRGLKNADDGEDTSNVAAEDKAVDKLESSSSSSNSDHENTVEEDYRRSHKSFTSHRKRMTETKGASIPKLYI